MKQFKFYLLLARSYFPTALPVGVTAFNKWADDIITLTGPIADEQSLKFAIATQVMHAPNDKSALPMQWFVRRILKTAANQIAGNAFQEIKTAQLAAQKAQEEVAKAHTSTPADTAQAGTPSVTTVLQG